MKYQDLFGGLMNGMVHGYNGSVCLKIGNGTGFCLGMHGSRPYI